MRQKPYNLGTTTVRQHLTGAYDNLEMAKWLCLNAQPVAGGPAWAVTISFYSAIHAVRGYLLAAHNQRVRNHDHMNSMYDTFQELKQTRSDYDYLKQQSHKARYYLWNFVWSDVDICLRSAESLLKNWAPQIRERIDS